METSSWYTFPGEVADFDERYVFPILEVPNPPKRFTVRSIASSKKPVVALLNNWAPLERCVSWGSSKNILTNNSLPRGPSCQKTLLCKPDVSKLPGYELDKLLRNWRKRWSYRKNQHAQGNHIAARPVLGTVLYPRRSCKRKRNI